MSADWRIVDRGSRFSDRGSTAIRDPRSEVLARSLQKSVDAEVRFDLGSRALYATDSSNYRQVPIGVVVPRTIDAVIAAVAICREHDAPLLARGGGTSLAGQCCNTAVILDFSKYLNQVIEIDPERRRAQVQPGVVLDHLRAQTEQHSLTFAPDPATHSRCTLGGMIGNNSCGVHSLMAGKTVENVEQLDVLTYDGLRLTVGITTADDFERHVEDRGREAEIYLRLKALRDRYEPLIRERFPNIPRRVSGYNLDQLLPEHSFHIARSLVGSEGTCVTVLGATLRLVHSPPGRSLLVLGYRDVGEAADDVMRVLATQPIGLEGIDDVLVDSMKRKGLQPQNLQLLPPGRGWLLVEFGADSQPEADARANQVLRQLTSSSPAPSGKVFIDRNETKLIWQIRESGLASAFIAADDPSWEGWEDAAVPPERLGTYLRGLRALYERYNYKGALYGHFGEGCVHTRTDFDLVTRAGITKFRAFIDEAADLVLGLGGSISGEHGDGQARGELLEKMFGSELVQAFREFKAIWDPAGRMNPGKLIDAYPITANLRLGTTYRPSISETHFRYPNDRGSFAHAQLRCVGVGACRKQDGGTMCPSYMATLEEKHSTRGRARLLFEMLQGDTLAGGWRSHEVKEALDLCLACKGCRHECPTSVDLATYKAEFLSHYYQGRVRPRAAYAMGLLPWWIRIGARLPSLANALAGREFSKRIAGIAPERAVPRIAPRSFVRTFAQRQSIPARVILWPDTFNNYFHPQTAHAAAAVLARAGFAVEVPRGNLCCGRPLYDWGFLKLARRLLRRVLAAIRPHLEAGVPIIVLEPSCAAVFRDELVNLFPSDIDALRLSRQTFLLAEFLDRHHVPLPEITRRALVHGHCHHKAVMRMSADEKILRRLGLDYQLLDAGCCGMAGAFGFERDKYDISVRIGERVLLPAVRTASADTLIIADGFSCREQISQLTGRTALHLAEVIATA